MIPLFRFFFGGRKQSLQVRASDASLTVPAAGAASWTVETGQPVHGEWDDKDELQAHLSNQASILRRRGDLDGALKLYRKQQRLEMYRRQEQLCRELGDGDGLQASLRHQGLILDACGDLEGAMTLYKQQEEICRQLENQRGLASSLANQAVLLSDKMDRRVEAMRLLEEAATAAQGAQDEPLLKWIRSLQR
ncbi:MAG: hypothetical protein EA424_11865 [Planctomycetaceae bacterium]|nr:MAG: hypothetical protein EA424_11865 [Planctomycetaceae bacterium]